ncbi:uncharacterized protein LOC134781839 [Penaeus indicus]|uniref:uncharacterized protein LOC134781839 n=1 Tax=Penaeus indicus TaxID=29960 RepID=UPI00300CFE40
MKLEVRNKKKPAAPSVKTTGIKKKTSAPSGVAKKVKKAAATEEVKKAITKEVKVKKVNTANPSPGGKKKAAVGSAAKVVNKRKKANKKANVASGKTKETAGDAASKGKVGIKRKQEEKENSSVDAGEKKKVRKKSNASEQKSQADGGKPGKKGNKAGPKLIRLQGKLSEIFWNRSLEVKARTLIVAMKDFSVNQSSDPVFESAHRIQTNKLKKLIFLEYKTKAEAKAMKNVLQKNKQIKYAKFMSRVSKEVKRPDAIMVHPKRLYIGNVPSEMTNADLKMKFPTALSVIVTHSKGKAKLIFKNRKDAKEAFEASSSVWCNGVKLTVLYFVPQSKPGGIKMKSTGKNTKGQAKKNVKGKNTSPKKKKSQTTE